MTDGLRQLHLLAFGNVRSGGAWRLPGVRNGPANQLDTLVATARAAEAAKFDAILDRKSTRLNSSHASCTYLSRMPSSA